MTTPRIPILLSFFLFLSIHLYGQETKVYKEPKFHFDWSKPSEYPDRIILNFGQNPSSEVNVTWRTTTEISTAFAEIAIATAAPKFWKNGKTLTAKTEVLDADSVKTAEVTAHYHSVEFRDLLPDTTYAYRVGDGERWSEWFQFKTASDQAEDKFSFLYVGDAQNYVLELWSPLIREGFRKAPDAKFIVHAGDLINTAHREGEFDIIRPKKDKKGNRRYTKDDIQKIRYVYHLVKEKGYTLQGAQEVIAAGKDQGFDKVAAVQKLQEIKDFLINLKNELKTRNGS